MKTLLVVVAIEEVPGEEVMADKMAVADQCGMTLQIKTSSQKERQNKEHLIKLALMEHILCQKMLDLANIKQKEAENGEKAQVVPKEANSKIRLFLDLQVMQATMGQYLVLKDKMQRRSDLLTETRIRTIKETKLL